MLRQKMRAVLAHKAKCRATGIHTPYDENAADQTELLSMMGNQRSAKKGLKQVKQVMGMMPEEQQKQMQAQIKATQPQLAQKLQGKPKSFFKEEKKDVSKPQNLYIPAKFRTEPLDPPTTRKRAFPKMTIAVPKLNELSKVQFQSGTSQGIRPFSSSRDIKELFTDRPSYVPLFQRNNNIEAFTPKSFTQNLDQLTMEVGQTKIKILKVITCPTNAIVKVPDTSRPIDYIPNTQRDCIVHPYDPNTCLYRMKNKWYECENKNAECLEYAKRIQPILENLKKFEKQSVYVEALAACLAQYGITQEENQSPTILSFHLYCIEHLYTKNNEERLIVPKLPLFWIKIE